MKTPVTPVLPVGATPDSDTFHIATLPSAVGFLHRAVQPPSQLYVESSDDLAVSCASSTTGEIVYVNYRLLRADGEVILGQFTVRPGNNRTPVFYSEGLAEGFLLSVSCRATVATTRGQTFVRIYLTDPALGAGQPSYVLLSDYVTTQLSPAHPGGRVLSPVEGPGHPYVVVCTPPGAGHDINTNVPANARWRVHGLLAFLTTDAVVANRLPGIGINTGGLSGFVGWCPSVIVASKGVEFGGAEFAPYVVATSNYAMLPLPPNLVALSGDYVGTVTAGLDPGDIWSQLELNVEEWLDNV